MRRRLRLLGLAGGLALGAAACASHAPRAIGAAPPAEPAAAARHLVLLSVDGLMPEAFTRADGLGLAVPNLRRLAGEGAFASGVQGVLPSVTYPSHTTLLTGVPPAVHGIYGNSFVDPLAISNDAWYWYAREIRVPTLVSAVRARGGTVGSVFWPVSVGLAADFLVPEFWRTGSTDSSDVELLRALSTPGLVGGVEALRGKPFGNPVTDSDRTDIALAILREHRPTLLLLHLGDVDHEEHAFGPGSPQAAKAIEEADRNLGRLLASLEELGLSGSTLVAVVSDHGFMKVTKVLRPNVLLVENGLLELDEKGKVTSWKAWFHSHGGSASLYLADPADETTLRKVRDILETRRRDPGSGIRAILDRPEIAALGGDPRAELFLDAADGFGISRAPTGGWLGDATDRGYHGYDPRRPDMRASLLLRGPGLSRSGDLGVVPMTRIAPTLAAWLGVELAAGAAPPLPLITTEPAKR
jgi:predicted AlkP superfamily pyrophosphatase or phosphodiesterase